MPILKILFILSKLLSKPSRLRVFVVTIIANARN